MKASSSDHRNITIFQKSNPKHEPSDSYKLSVIIRIPVELRDFLVVFSHQLFSILNSLSALINFRLCEEQLIKTRYIHLSECFDKDYTNKSLSTKTNIRSSPLSISTLNWAICKDPSPPFPSLHH